MYWRTIGRWGIGELVVKEVGRDSMWDQVK